MEKPQDEYISGPPTDEEESDDYRRGMYHGDGPSDWSSSEVAIVPEDETSTSEEVEGKGKEPLRTVTALRRTTSEGSEHNTVDTTEEIEIIDSHAHLGGKSVSGQTELRLLTRGIGRGTGASFLYYNASPDKRLAKKLIDSLEHYCGERKRPRIAAAVSLVLDMGYVPLQSDMKSNISRIGAPLKATESSFGEEEYYSYGGSAKSMKKEYVWYPRRGSDWATVIRKVAEACKKRPGKLWPFVGFDPRRPDGIGYVRKAIGADGAYVGVKLYSRLGWMPIHNRRLYGDDLGDPLDQRCDQLYQYLVANDIPVLVHTSPTGFPPDGWMVMPWTCTKLRRQAIAAVDFEQTTNVPCPNGFGTIAPAIWPPTYTEKRPYKRLSKTDEDAAIRHAASYLGHYCVYNQLTTSPYSWEPVMLKYPGLRLCLAHFGAEVGVYSTPMRDVPYFEPWQEVLELHPYVAGAEYPKHAGTESPRDFVGLFKRGVLRLIESECKKTAARAKALIYGSHWFENDSDWSKWLTNWCQAYPISWHEKVLEMITNPGHPNLYTDIAYLTTKRDQFPGVFKPLVKQALEGADDKGKELRKKLMIGTDWFMIELQSFSPRDFWKMVDKSFFPKYAEPAHAAVNRLILWQLWSRDNCLRWINHQPRFAGVGMDKMESFYFEGVAKDKLPGWWKSMRKFYEDGKHMMEPQFCNPPAPPSDDGGYDGDSEGPMGSYSSATASVGSSSASSSGGYEPEEQEI